MQIEHLLMPGFTMDVLGEEPCEVDASRPTPHQRYRVIDPEGNEDWVCAYDARTLPDGRTPEQRGLHGFPWRREDEQGRRST